VGFWLANIVANVVQRGEYNSSRWLGNLVRILIMGLVLAMGLRAMGIADSIVNLALDSHLVQWQSHLLSLLVWVVVNLRNVF
jgi:predicted lipid-binding transport protein (Tim44 family)